MKNNGVKDARPVVIGPTHPKTQIQHLLERYAMALYFCRRKQSSIEYDRWDIRCKLTYSDSKEPCTTYSSGVAHICNP